MRRPKRSGNDHDLDVRQRLLELLQETLEWLQTANPLVDNLPLVGIVAPGNG
jgi:hypothetical protein